MRVPVVRDDEHPDPRYLGTEHIYTIDIREDDGRLVMDIWVEDVSHVLLDGRRTMLTLFPGPCR